MYFNSLKKISFALFVLSLFAWGCKKEAAPPVTPTTPPPQADVTSQADTSETKSESAQPKEASSFTKDANAELLKFLPFDNMEDFADVKKGFIAPLPDGGVIKNEKGEPIYDLSKFAFIKEGQPAPETVNPSLWRQSQKIMVGGLFQVTDRIYQVRAADLSNITFIEGDKGIIIMDPLVSEETAKAALDLYYQHRPKKPVVAVIYSHSHVDHYGGVRGVVNEDDVKAGKVKIFAPEGFLDHAVAENVMAGNAMSRRASYMYGNILPANPQGQVGAGLGPTTSFGTVTLIPPTDIIKTNGEKKEIEGLTFVFWMAPDSEAPSEMFFYIPQLKALSTAEDATHTLHNTYSLRGAKIRNPLAWSKYLNQVLGKWGDEVEVLYAPHHWPVWGNENVVSHIKKQRDMYRYLNDEPLRLANHGYTMVEIGEMVKLPDSLAKFWSQRGYYGSVNHDAKSTYVKYLGWFNGNPATLYRLPRVEASKRYVETMGGADKVLKKAREYYDQGDYRWVAELVNHVVFAEPNNQEAKNLQANALEQLGYQSESGPWRNFFLSGAKELREGVKKMGAPSTASPDTIKAMDLDLLFDWVAMRLNGPKAAGIKSTFNLNFTDTNQLYLLELENGVLNHLQGVQSKKPDVTLTLSRQSLNEVLLGQNTLEEKVQGGEIQVVGDKAKLTELISLLDTFEFWFNLVTPVTKGG